MTLPDERILLVGFVVFCRIGACMAIAPGFSSPRIPPRVRLFAALGVTITVAPSLLEGLSPASIDQSAARLAILIVGECGIGATMGLLGRLVFASLETTFTAASMAIGLSSAFAPRVDESETMPELAAFVVFGMTTLFFVAELHWEVIRAVFDSYAALPLGAILSPEVALEKVASTLSAGLAMAFRLAAPFLAFGIVATFSFALLNKITPQVAIYFVATPAVMLSGIALLPFVWPDMATIFIAFFSDWLRGL